jgi:hypothetical protein
MASAAARYLDLGWNVIPVDGTTKKPLIGTWKEFQTRRAAPDEIESWSRRFPSGGIAVICGKISGLLVLDADGAEGVAEAERRGLPKTPMVKTPGGGMHIYFKLPHGFNSPSSCKVGDSRRLDVRGDGSYVAAPHTKRSDGRRYEWVVKPSTKLADAPEWWRKLLKQRDGGELERRRQKVEARTSGLPLVGAGFERLDPVVRGWIENGHDLERFPSRSECDFAAVMALLAIGMEDDEIERVFATYPIGERYREPGTGGPRYLELTIRTARRKLKAVRIKYADLTDYEADGRKSGCRRLHLALVVEDGDDVGRWIRTGITVPSDGREACAARWQRLFEALGVPPIPPGEVTPRSFSGLVGRTLVVEVDRSRQQNQVVAFHKGRWQ